ncbi:MAG: type I methionyl aminopeptidase [Magnetococcales bacterium]|nr:type I methionyl aminopeptidase [Magnetococcales bacterium]
MISIKTEAEIAAMRRTCRLAAETLQMVEHHVVAGVTTQELNDICHRFILEHGATPSPLNYRGFPRSICTSVNQQVCHGIPGKRILKSGDIINIDITTYLDGFHGDTSKTFHVGKPTPKGDKICQVAKACLDAGIRVVRPGARLGDIGWAVEQMALSHHCTVVREYCGHGIGREFHEEPAVLHYGKPNTGTMLQQGMIFTIEPMVNLGKPEIRHMPDKWTVVTRDHSLSSQFEHTILVTATGCDVLTSLDGEYLCSLPLENY